MEKIFLSPISEENLTQLLRNVVREELNKKTELNAEMLSPAEAIKLFNPAITVQTLRNYAREGIITPHSVGRRVFYDRKEIMEKVVTIKKFSHNKNIAHHE